MQKAGIIGCGWLGFPLAKKLIVNGFEVRGTTTRLERFDSLSESNIQPYLFQLGDRISASFFEDLDVVILCFPISSKYAAEQYFGFIQDLSHKIDPKTAIIFTSSISVYLPFQGELDESNGVLDEDSINYQFEKELQKQLKNDLTILRLGGLIGENRHPVRFLAGRTLLENGDAPINLVHQNDVIRLIEQVIFRAKFNTIYNCVYPFHPTKKEYYEKAAIDLGLTPPTFTFSHKNHKIVKGQKACEDIDFVYQCCP